MLVKKDDPVQTSGLSGHVQVHRPVRAAHISQKGLTTIYIEHPQQARNRGCPCHMNPPGGRVWVDLHLTCGQCRCCRAAASFFFQFLVHIGRRARLAVVLSLVLAIVALSIAGPLASARAAEKRDQILRGEWNIALSYRGDAWLAAIDILQRNPLLGTGHGTFKSEFAEARLRRVEAGQPVSRANVNPHFANTHNDYLEVGAELGLIGLAALAWGLSELVRAVARAGPDRALAAAGSSAIAVLALGYFPFETPLLAYPAILFLAWVFSRSPASGTAEAAAA